MELSELVPLLSAPKFKPQEELWAHIDGLTPEDKKDLAERSVNGQLREWGINWIVKLRLLVFAILVFLVTTQGYRVLRFVQSWFPAPVEQNEHEHHNAPPRS